MVAHTLAPKWSPLGLLQRLRNLIHEPSDLRLALHIGFYWWRLPGQLARDDLPTLLRRLQASPRPPAPDLAAAVRRIGRLRQPWERLALFHDRNTCYLRALILYRFLDPGARPMHIHFGVEPGIDPNDRLHGHAWISVGDDTYEAPDPVRAGRVREIYRFPGDGTAPAKRTY